MDGRRPTGQQQSGSSLLEVLVALLILGLVFPGLAAFLITTLRAGEVAQNRSNLNVTANEAEFFAQNAVDFRPCSATVGAEFLNDLNTGFADPSGLDVKFVLDDVVSSRRGAKIGGMAIFEEVLWVTDEANDEVVGLDLSDPSPAVSADRIIARVRVGDRPKGVVVVAQGNVNLWVANSGSSSLTRIPLGLGYIPGTPVTYTYSNALLAPTGLAYDDSAVTSGGRALWVTEAGSGEVSKIDLDGTPSGSIRTPLAVGASPTSIAVGNFGVWVAGSASVSWIRPRPSNSLYPSGGSLVETRTGFAPSTTTGSLAYDGSSSFWLAQGGLNQLVRLSVFDPFGNGPIQAEFKAFPGISPQGLAFGPPGDLWVANYGDDRLVNLDSSLPDLVPVAPTPLRVRTDPMLVAVDTDFSGDVFVSSGSGFITKVSASGVIDSDPTFKDLSISLGPCDSTSTGAEDLQRWTVTVQVYTSNSAGALPAYSRQVEFWKGRSS